MILGIDPGLSGGLAAIDRLGSLKATWPMPVLPNRSLDLIALKGALMLAANFGEPIDLVVLELASARPGQGVSSMFKFGRVFGAVEAMLACLAYPYELVSPQRWAKAMQAGISSDLDPKERSLVAVNRLFPTAPLLGSARARTPHSGIVDAILIAEYGRRRIVCPRPA